MLTLEPLADFSRYDSLRSEWQAEYAIQQKPVMPELWLGRLIKAEQVDRQTPFKLPTQSGTLSHSSRFDTV